MRFNAKDFYATALVAAVVAVYIAYLRDGSGWAVSSTRGTTAVVAGLGVGAFALGRVADLYSRDRSFTMAAVATWASLLGIIAVGAVVVALVTADPAALATLVAATAAMWVTATVRHLLTAPDGLASATPSVPEPPRGVGQDRESPRETDDAVLDWLPPDVLDLEQRPRPVMHH